MKTDDIIAQFERLEDKEKVNILHKALSIKVAHRTSESAIIMALGYYRDITKKGEWTK